MARYANGKRAYAMCDRSGWKVLYKDLRTEWTGARVHKSLYEGKHPQLTPVRNIRDPQALRDPRPDNDTEAGTVTQIEDLIDMTHGAT